jgi:hypothetical protein
MFKYVLSLTFAVSLASTATISTSATCDGVTTVGTFGARCDDGLYMAFASLSAPSFVDTQIGLSDFGVSVDVSGSQIGRGTATANFSDNYVFTMYGGIGNGSYCPGILIEHGSGASASMTFGGTSTGNCITFAHVPFTFGVPQIVSIDMGAETSGVGALSGGASAFLQSIVFFDPAGKPTLERHLHAGGGSRGFRCVLARYRMAVLCDGAEDLKRSCVSVPSPIVRQPAAAG